MNTIYNDFQEMLRKINDKHFSINKPFFKIFCGQWREIHRELASIYY